MPFGLTFSQLLDLGNAVPGLVDDVKAAQPKLSPLLLAAAAMLESPELKATLTKVDALLASPDTHKTLTEAAALVKAAQELAPTLAPTVRKVEALLKIVATTDSHAQAVAQARQIDIAGAADRS